MTQEIVNDEGIILSVRRAGEGGRAVRLFLRRSGRETAFLSRSALRKYGTGALLPFTRLRVSLLRSEQGTIAVQYEGRPILDTLALSYDELCCWYYASELVSSLFPEGEADADVFALLASAAEAGRARNKKITAFILAVQLLRAAGYDPGEDEPREALGLSEAAEKLLTAFLAYRWRGELGETVGRAAFEEAARYIDRFIETYCETEMKTRGAFLGNN